MEISSESVYIYIHNIRGKMVMTFVTSGVAFNSGWVSKNVFTFRIKVHFRKKWCLIEDLSNVIYFPWVSHRQ